MVRHWNKLPRKVVVTPSLKLWAAWSRGRRCPCPRLRDWNKVICKLLPDPNHSLILTGIVDLTGIIFSIIWFLSSLSTNNTRSSEWVFVSFVLPLWQPLRQDGLYPLNVRCFCLSISGFLPFSALWKRLCWHCGSIYAAYQQLQSLCKPHI